MAKTRTSKKLSSKTPIQVDIVSDIVCPWCWVGIKLFQKAAKQSGQKITLSWRPYMLDPSVPEGGTPYKDYMKQKFGDGPSDRFKAMRAQLEKVGPELGIDFKFGDIPMRPNTLNAHRLLKWAQGQDKGDAASEALFKAFFTDLKDVGNLDVLTEVGKTIGMDAELTHDLLSGEDDKNAVREEIMFFRNLGVNAVPTFIYNGQFAIQGAQAPEAHLDAIKKAGNTPPSP